MRYIQKKYVKEDLPLPYVFYGIPFIFFRKTQTSESKFCSCSRSALMNYFKLEGDRLVYAEDDPFRERIHPLFLKRSKGYTRELKKMLRFSKNICHRCNQIPPSIEYSNEFLDTVFMKKFGWYADMNSYQKGFDPYTFEYLDRICSGARVKDIKELLTTTMYRVLLNNAASDNVSKIYQDLSRQREWVIRPDGSIGGKRRKLPPKSSFYKDIEKIRNTLRKHLNEFSSREFELKRNISRDIENTTRSEFNHKKVGEEWTNEKILYDMVKRIYRNHEVKLHFRPLWLEKLELDIFVPHLNLGIEYQGEQHYRAVEIWGGSKALKKQKERDRRKAILCKRNDVTLVKFKFGESLTEKFVKKSIKDSLS